MEAGCICTTPSSHIPLHGVVQMCVCGEHTQVPPVPRRRNSHSEEAGGPRLSPRGREHPNPTSRPRPDLLNSQLPAFSLTELPFCLGGPAASQSHLHPPAQCRQNLLGNMSCLRKYEPGIGGGRVGLLPASSLNMDLVPEGVGASCIPSMVEVGSSTL